MSFTAHHSLTKLNPDRFSLAAWANTATRPLIDTLQLWRSRIRERHAFPVLDDRELHDLRLSRWEFDRELAKPFWRG